MKILVVGSGGREHAIIKKLRENPQIDKIFALPGNAGMKNDAETVDIPVKDIAKTVEFAKNNKIDFAVVAPDDPLVAGEVDALEAAGIPCFGPTANAAIIEGSKIFSKELMKKYGIPTAKYEVFSELEAAEEYLKTAPLPTVIKADGLALGKGVVISETKEDAISVVRSMMQDKVFGESGSRVVVEEFLTGPEVSVLAFTDGKCVKPMVSSMDHKRALDGDKGLNTGGMGTIAPNPFYTEDIADICEKTIFLPTINAMNAEGRTFRGCLYFGLMLTKDGPKVIEYNCRFGDPETQVVLPLLDGDLLEIFKACRNGTLKDCPVKVKSGAAACIILASGGYPKEYKTGYPIICGNTNDAQIFFAGAKEKDGEIVTGGGRVAGVTAVRENLKSAVTAAYQAAVEIHFEDMYYRKDIGARALSACKSQED